MSKVTNSLAPLRGTPFVSTKLADSSLIRASQRVCNSNLLRRPVLAIQSQKYSTFNAHASASNDSANFGRQKKLPLWPRVKAFTTFTISGALIIGATGLSAIVIYLIGSELFSPSGDTQIFNRSVSVIEKDEMARTLLQCEDTEGKKERLKAYGETFTNDKWTRNRPISSSKQVDKYGKAHYYMRFHVESKLKRGLVHIEAIESEKHYQPDFTSMYIDIPGEKRHYLIKPKVHKIVKPNGFLGVNWGPKK